MKMVAIPPTTPPAMAAVFELLPPEGGGVGDLAEDTLEEDAGVTDTLEEDDVGARDTPEGPRIEPGPNSGESPTAYDWLAFQSFSVVTSIRAH